MDFLDIRKKAKERAQARAAEESAAAERPAAEPPAPPAQPGPVVTEEDVLQGALAARLQGLPEAGAPAPAGRFTTWRPGSGDPPPLPPEDDRAPPPPASADEFTILAPAPLPVATSLRGAAVPVDAAPPGAVEPPPDDPLDEFFYRPGEAAPALPHIAPAVAPEEAPAPVVREEYLTFLLGAEEYAVAVGRVREVVKAPPIAEVPRAPAHVVGVVTVRGEVVAVIDPRLRLGLPAAPEGEGRTKIVIVDAGEGPCGLLVDRLASVVRLLPGSIEPCPQGIAGHRSEFLAGIGRAGERLFTVLDLVALLRPGPRAEGTARPRRADAGA